MFKPQVSEREKKVASYSLEITITHVIHVYVPLHSCSYEPVLTLCCHCWVRRCRDGCGLGAGDWSPHDVWRCSSHQDLGHGQRDEGPGNELTRGGRCV